MAPYPTAAVTDPRGPPRGDSHVVRGGSYADSDVVGVDAVHRTAVAADFHDPTVGVRCAR